MADTNGAIPGSQEEYFSKRAPRYARALEGCPHARDLDLLPYLAAVDSLGSFDRVSRICDAFGGNGFVASRLSSLGVEVTVADFCPEMMFRGGASELIRFHRTPDDFLSLLNEGEEEGFDLVVAHGGLHHVVETGPDGSIDEGVSRHRQSSIVERLAKLVAPGGLFILGDIPLSSPPTFPRVLMDLVVPPDVALQVLGKTGFDRLEEGCSVPLSSGLTLGEVQESVADRLWAPVEFPVPKRFFEEFVAVRAPLGHSAVWPNLNAIEREMSTSGLEVVGSYQYLGPWLFEGAAEAGWFFREKFSFFQESPRGADTGTEKLIASGIQMHLGLREVPNIVAVNWGVSYTIARRPR